MHRIVLNRFFISPSITVFVCVWQPQLVTFEEQTQQYKDEITKLETEEAELVQHVNDCVGSRPDGVVCGLSANQAPSPWLALNDVPCRGYATKQTREKDYCGYWCGSHTRSSLCSFMIDRSLHNACAGIVTSTRTQPTAT